MTIVYVASMSVGYDGETQPIGVYTKETADKLGRIWPALFIEEFVLDALPTASDDPYYRDLLAKVRREMVE